MALVRGAIEELFGPIVSPGSNGAALLRSPDDPLQDAEAMVEALQRVAQYLRDSRS